MQVRQNTVSLKISDSGLGILLKKIDFFKDIIFSVIKIDSFIY